MKTKLSLLLFAALCTVFLITCSSDAEVTNTTGLISGSVVDKTTGEPITVANVKLQPSGRSTVTGSDGAFEFRDMDAGKYSVSVTKEGYNPGEATVTVTADNTTECHILLERIPSVVTADCDELDFGESLTTLAFSIVNDGYVSLEWHIEYDTQGSWIREVKPSEGVLSSGKTAAIVVTIDRNKLKGGNNETTLIVVSNNGKHEIKAKAIGEDKVLPELNILPTPQTDITSNSAILYGDITNPGKPQYTERGIVYSKQHNPTVENTIEKLTAPTSENPTYTCKADNLELGATYYFRAYARNSVGIAYSSNEEKITTYATPPAIIVHEATSINIEGASATLNGEVTNVGDPHYSEKGFVYGFASNPTIADTREMVGGTDEGRFYLQVHNLTLDRKYFVRSYIINSQGTYYSNNEVTFTVATTLPEVLFAGVSKINVENRTVTLNGLVKTEGVPAYTARGFVYGLSSSPTLSDYSVEATGSGVGEYSCKISDLELNKVYYARAYTITNRGPLYSENQKTFILSTQGASVTIKDVTNHNIDQCSAVFNAEITDAGTPAYTERGFVYNTSGNPSTLDEKIVVDGNGPGTYSTKVSNLKLNTQYYVRAYVVNEHGTVYSAEQKQFILTTTAPSVTVEDVSGINYTTKSAILHGTMANIGNPKFSERGFVYGVVANPNVYGNKIIASSSGDTFSMSVLDLKVDTKYYVRCYAIQNGNVYYSDNEVSFTIEATLPEISSLVISNIDYEARSVLFTANVTNAGDPAMNEKGFVYSTTTNPNIYDNDKISSINKELGEYSLTAKELKPGTTYYVRAYAMNEGGVAYSAEQSFSLTYTKPELSSGVSVDENNINKGYAIVRASIVQDGNPRYTERGFVYATHDTPTISDNYIVVPGNGAGSFSGRLENLELNKKYWVRAYVKTEIGYYYTTPRTSEDFNTFITNPSISCWVGEVDLVGRTAFVEGRINFGTLSCSERGFVYSETNSSPTINDTKVIIPGMDTEQYVYTLTNLKLDSYYYVRAYAITKIGVHYSLSREISTQQTLPTLGDIVVVENFGTKKAIFGSEILKDGNPKYTEAGFVYSTTNQVPTIKDTKCIANNFVNNVFTYNAENLPSSGPVYVRAYAMNQAGVAYGQIVKKIFDPNFLIYDNYVEIPELGLAVTTEQIGQCDWDAAIQLCSGLRYGGYANWRLPTISELSSLANYAPRLNLVGYGSSYPYWTSTLVPQHSDQVHTYYFSSNGGGTQTWSYKIWTCNVLAVRTLTK